MHSIRTGLLGMTLTFFGLGLIAYQNWVIGLGLFLAMWGQNMENLYRSRNAQSG